MSETIYAENEELVSAAALLCSIAHGVQSHSGGLHTQHCLRVTMIVVDAIRPLPNIAFHPYTRAQVLAAAILHDVPEDQPEFATQVQALHPNVYQLVLMVRNPSTDMASDPPAGVTWDDWRETKKKLDAEHLLKADAWARLTKLGDRTDNCERAVSAWDRRRCKRYAGETRRHFWPVLSDCLENPYTAKALPGMLVRLDRALVAMETLEGR